MKFKSSFVVPSQDFKSHDRMVLVVNSNLEDGELLYTEPVFKVVIPNFMFDAVADTEAKFSTEPDINKRHRLGLRENPVGCFGDNEITHKFKKTQTAHTLSELKDFFRMVTDHIVERHALKHVSMKKKIFIGFGHSQQHTTNDWCGSYWGEMIKQNFRYFLGYERHVEKNGSIQKEYVTKIRYASPYSSTKHLDTGFKEGNEILPLPSHHQNTKTFSEMYSIIDWTEEREAFCEKIKQTFISVNTELSSFLKNLDSEKFDRLMTNNNLKFLSDGKK